MAPLITKCRSRDKLNNVLYYNTFNNGLEELLQYADRNSMAHGAKYVYHSCNISWLNLFFPCLHNSK